MKRSIASVMLGPHQRLRFSDFAIQANGLKMDRLNRLEKRIAKLQQARKREPLKRIHQKRLHVSEYYDRLAAKQVATSSRNSLVVGGYPKGIKYEKARGNRKAPTTQNACMLDVRTHAPIHSIGICKARDTVRSVGRTPV